jgi:hypothetical protein
MAQTNKDGPRTVSTYLPADLTKALEAQARAEDRTLSQVIRRTLRTAIGGDAAPEPEPVRTVGEQP